MVGGIVFVSISVFIFAILGIFESSCVIMDSEIDRDIVALSTIIAAAFFFVGAIISVVTNICLVW